MEFKCKRSDINNESLGLLSSAKKAEAVDTK